MIDNTSVAESLRELALRVKDSDPGGHDRLMLLSQSVSKPSPADAWASSDIHELIDPDNIVERYKSKKFMSGIDQAVTIMEIIRNTLIFAPIMFTWYAISQATAAYYTYISPYVKANKPEFYQQPFLYLWQQSFGGNLPDSLTLSNVAGVDVLLLCIILVLTFGTYFLSNISGEQKERDVLKLRSDLAHALAGAVLSMHARPQLTASGNLEQVARQLDGMARYVVGQYETMAKQTTVAFDTMAKATTDRFDKLARDMTGQFMSSTQQAKAQLDQITQAMTRQLQEGSEYVRQLGSFTTGVVNLSTQVKTASDELKNVNAALTASINSLVTPAEAMARQQEKLLEEVQKSAGLLQNTAGAITDLATRQHKMAAELTDCLDSLSLAIEKFDKLAKEQGNMVNQQTNFMQHLQVEHDRQAQLASMMADATIKVKDALEELRNGAVSLRSITVDMNDIMRLQAARSSQASGYDGAVPPEYIQAMQGYANAARMMEGGAVAIQRASQQLKDVLDNWNRKNGHN